MNRRGFIASLVAIPAGLAAAAKAAAMPPVGVNLDELFELARAIKRGRELSAVWMQTTRVMHVSTLAYEDAIDAALIPDERERRKRWHERRKERSRARFSQLQSQRPLPLP